MLQVSQELSHILGQPSVRDEFDLAFLKWSKVIIGYSKDTQLRSTAIQLVTQDYDSEDECTPGNTSFDAPAHPIKRREKILTVALGRW